MEKIYQVIVTGLTGNRLTIDVGHSENEMNSMAVSELKKKISDKMPGKPGYGLRLSFDGKMLEDSAKLSVYGIKDKSTIFLIFQLPGGQVC